ncbi:hypothetical protein HA444_24420 [Klebsiella grimontii]|uniref:hypothetical protein n=1 Tax=Klebsiella grimontii TaxID=2058152 RepID=UPI0016661927|nr:hypothetical protein [Klebsiella grimontii]MBD0905764.1 hypothetical protein [Klebsiella grimontii]
MLEFFKEIISSIKSNSSERAKNYYLGAFLFSWVTINWQFVLTLLFSESKIEDRISMAKSFLTTDSVLFNPITMSVVLCIGLPVVNMIIAYAQNRPNKFLRKDSHAIKVSRLRNETETETLRAERDIAYKKKSVSESLEVQTLQAQIQESKDVSLKLSEENANLTEELKIVKDELNVYIKDSITLKTQASQINKEYEKLEAELKHSQNTNTDILNKLEQSELRFEKANIDINLSTQQLLDEKSHIEARAKQLEERNASLQQQIETLTSNSKKNKASQELTDLEMKTKKRSEDLASRFIIESAQFGATEQLKKIAESPTMQAIRSASQTPVSLAMSEAAALTNSLRRTTGVEPGKTYLDNTLKTKSENLPDDLNNK